MIDGVRQFKFKNRFGQEYDATRADALFWEPDGLGWGIAPTLQNIGHGYVVTSKQLDLPQPSGTMVFRNYTEYEVFLDFVQSGGLVFCYKPLDTWRYLDCYVSIGKSEIDHDNNHLLCPITVHGTSQWYEAVVAFESQEDDDGGKKYSYKYPYQYAGGVSGAVEIENGLLDSYPRITIFGPAANPVYSLYQGTERIAQGRILATIPDGHKLVIDAHPATMEIAEYTDNGVFVADRYQDSDFTTERIFAIPSGDSRMVFAQDGLSIPNAFVEVRKRV